ncbi:carbohydrate ABC transporter permease [Brachybacterium phenoliresistens]|uniref:ABC transporter permease n=1 Tax=Brachybacterium phenoliresistens TaxID=396014 RepID=Z9JPI5_9MICO|nr:carbohydrate ABC transporter permease [Brachybacterium phenoliresistens]EWS80074.1 ABC transporter permease [Brachybacterium phenoliresistens]
MAAPTLSSPAGRARPHRPAPSRGRSRGTGRAPWEHETPPLVAALKAVIIVGISLTMVYPLVYIVMMSFAAPSQAHSGTILPTAFSLDAYRAIFRGDAVLQGLGNSLWLTVVGTSLSMVFTTTMAWGLTRTRDVPGARLVLLLALGTMLFNAGMIPHYLLIRSLGLLDSSWSLVLPGLISAFNMVVVRNFFMGLPRDLLDSARIDGAGEWRIFLTIALPLSKPVLAVMSLFYAVGCWNMYFNAMLYLNDASKWPIQVVLQQYVLAGVPLPGAVAAAEAPPPALSLNMAIIVVATVPILVAYPFIQKYFRSGVLTGAIKG